MKFYLFILILFAWVSEPFAVESSDPKAFPNIIIILADDMGYDSVAALNPESNLLKTPHIDRLISQGLIFTDGHSAASVCTPSRYGLLTGRYCWRTPLKKQVIWTYGKPLIDADRLTLPDVLKAQGYYTACIGKWHLGMGWPSKDGTWANKDLLVTDSTWNATREGKQRVRDCQKKIDFTKPIFGPLEHGFDYYYGVDLPNMSPYTWIENDRVLVVPSVEKPKSMFGSVGIMDPEFKLEDILPKISQRATSWIGEASQKKQPFFLYLSLTSPHTPIAPSKEFIGKSGLGKYGDYIFQTDWVVGEVMKALDAAKVSDNTLLIFSCDNGTARAEFEGSKDENPNLGYHYRGKKLSIFEGGHRVPFVVRWPGKTKPQTTNDQTVCLNDLMATFAELTGYDLPENAAEDSTSILPLLTGEATQLPDYPGLINHSYHGEFSIRNGSWKLMFLRGSKENPELRPALYDLSKDPKERKNRIAEFPELSKTLLATLKRSVEKGRTTPGAKQSNSDNQNSWTGLPWNEGDW